VDPRFNHRGKSYSEWICDWFNWFLSAYADTRNSGPVVFLRSHGIPNKITGAYTSDVPGQLIGSDTQGCNSIDPSPGGIYVNDPNIRIGSDKLVISDDQAVLVPIIIAYVFLSKIGEQYIGTTFSDLGTSKEYNCLTIDNGDNPPLPGQLTINENYVKISDEDMKQFRIGTPIFPAVVPDAPYGTSIKDFLEEGSVAPGCYPALVEGYFVMLNNFEPGNTYWVHSWASAGKEVRGPYFSELLYQIEVVKGRKLHGQITGTRPPRNENVFKRTLSEKLRIGELTNPELNRFGRIYDSLPGRKLNMKMYRKMIR
jgi:hypothetical protein